ncbi:Protein MKT1 [Lachnellula subtilissima]|uniref:Protein MKT1 n=1 Tax=Lachnellula subtilissima TaxID=602034 RepID=A0A8H8RR74_9HELO|nr:Protein MKT1 [Lachnellula subtilissima]
MDDPYFDSMEIFSPDSVYYTPELFPFTPQIQQLFPSQYPQTVLQSPGGSVGYVPQYEHDDFNDWEHAASGAFSPNTTVLSATTDETYYDQRDTDQRTKPARNGDPYILERKVKMEIADLKNSVIGVDATAYLQQMIIGSANEPLLAALGGDPLTLKQQIGEELDRWKSNDMTPVFVFDGQSNVGKNEVALRKAKQGLDQTSRAWKYYGDTHPEIAVQTFGASGAIRVQELYKILQDVLLERNLDFKIAPFSACAQLAYLLSLETHYIDAIMGSQELLLYDIHDAVIFPPSGDDWDDKLVYGVLKSDILEHLKVTPEMLADALLMVGTSFLPPFPPLKDVSIITKQPASIKDAANLLRTSEKSVSSTCNAFSDILQQEDPKWLDKYRKAKMLVKHCCIVHEDGKLEVRHSDVLTGDNQEYLGLRLPAELYYYLSQALIGHRLLDQFLFFETLVFPTLDGVSSDEYRRLVTRSLVPLKEITAALIVPRLHRVFQHKTITLKYWFDDSAQQTLNPRSMIPITTDKADTWGVKDPDLKPQETALGLKAGQLSFAVLSLQQKEFAVKSILKDKGRNSLTSKPEVLSSALWRLLHLRGYVNDKHELTNWGKALATTLKALGPTIKKYDDVHHVEEAAFLAFELLQFDNLNSRHRRPDLIGGPLRGTDEDKEKCILIGRTSCLLKLRHKSIGYTGPLSLNLLAYHSIIKAIREADRDLVEAVMASMFLSGQASRTPDRKDWAELGQSLPFSADVDIALGIAVKTYLDDFVKLDIPAEKREQNKQEYKEKYLPNSVNFVEDLDVAFKFFDAVYEGVKTLGDEIGEADKQAWDGAKAYLAERR